jgi:hypothetical protein
MSNQASGSGPDPAEWADLLQQLRQQSAVGPRPFFYARVQARLAARHEALGAWLPGWARRPAYVALLSALILAVSGDGVALRPAATASPYPTYEPSSVSPSAR